MIQTDVRELIKSGRAQMTTRATPHGEVETAMVYKTVPGLYMEKSADGDILRNVEIIASTPDLDAYGDIIVQSGWDLTRFKQNPVLLIDHWNRIENVVGKASKVKKSKEALSMMGTLDDDTNETASLLRARLTNGSVKTVSVGFVPLAWEKILDAEGEWTGGFKFLKSELLEVSFVAIPANIGATATPAKDFTAELISQTFEVPVEAVTGTATLNLELDDTDLEDESTDAEAVKMAEELSFLIHLRNAI